jgi:predicted regulator of Ras-like GTPase activity (Roadblock/LC7/MglB family)
MNKLEQLLGQVRSEMGVDFVSTDVVGMDGLSIAGGSVDPNFDAAAASARFAMVIKLGQKVSSKINMGDMEDILVTTGGIYIIARFLGDGSYYWGLSVTKDATLGMVRMLMNEYADQLWNAIPR